MIDKPLSVAGFDVAAVEERYGVSYVGYYDRNPGSPFPMLIFYQPDPQIELGHTHYMGLFTVPLTEDTFVTNAIRVVENEYPAVQLENGSFIVSRYRHDYQTGPRGEMIDGGCDYHRFNPAFPPTHVAIIRDGKERVLLNFISWLKELDAIFVREGSELAQHWVSEEEARLQYWEHGLTPQEAWDRFLELVIEQRVEDQV